MKINAGQWKLLNERFLPLGQVPNFDGNQLSLSPADTRRFIFDGWHVERRGKSRVLADAAKFNPSYIGFGLFDTLSTVIPDYNLYSALYSFFDQVEQFAATKIHSCSQTVAVFSHSSFGERLFPHIHQDDDDRRPTFSLFFNLTQEFTQRPVLTLFDELSEESKSFKRGYTDHKLLLVHERKAGRTDFVLNDQEAIIFDAWKTPHAFSYTDDLWVTVVYDHVELIEPQEKNHVFSISI